MAYGSRVHFLVLRCRPQFRCAVCYGSCCTILQTVAQPSRVYWRTDVQHGRKQGEIIGEMRRLAPNPCVFSAWTNLFLRQTSSRNGITGRSDSPVDSSRRVMVYVGVDGCSLALGALDRSSAPCWSCLQVSQPKFARGVGCGFAEAVFAEGLQY